MADFDWHGSDNDSVVLGYQPPTAVYSSGDSVRIRQQADQAEDHDPEIFLTPQGALAVAWRLIEVAHLAGLPEPSLSLMALEDRPTMNRDAIEHAADRMFGPGKNCLPADDREQGEAPLLVEMARRGHAQGKGQADAA
jgi:hypothetical protein